MTPTKGDAMSRRLFGIAPKPVLPGFPVPRFGREVEPSMRRRLAAKKLHPKLHRRHERGSRNGKGRLAPFGHYLSKSPPNE
jgi:hypothetical protein